MIIHIGVPLGILDGAVLAISGEIREASATE